MTPTQLKATRRLLGLTQAELGRALGYSPGNAARQVRRMETAVSNPSHRPVSPQVAAHIRTMLSKR